MSSNRDEVMLDELPAAGEPLTVDIHEDNQAVLEAEFAERRKQLNAMLPKREMRRLQKRWRQLHKKLNRAGYNQLIQRRYELHQQYLALKHDWTNAREAKKPRRHITKKAMAVKAEGKAVVAALAPLLPLAEEFEEIGEKFRLHQQAVDFQREDEENWKAFQREAYTWEAQIRSVFKQSARLHHRWSDAKGNFHLDIPRIQRILFKHDAVFYLISVSGQNVFEKMLNRWHSTLPYNVDIKALSADETLENLSAACNRVVTVARGQRGTNLFYRINRADAPDAIPRRMLYSKAVQWFPVDDHRFTPWIGGVTENRKVSFYDFETFPHVLVAGSTRSGKSNHLNQMIATLVSMYSPAQVGIGLIDNKGGVEFTHWEGLHHLIMPMVKSADLVLPTLKQIRAMMEVRLEHFAKFKAKKLSAYNERVKPEDRKPRLIFFVDELATLIGLGDLTADIHREMSVISSQGAAVGIHLVLCTQHPSVEVIPQKIKTNMTLRIAFKLPSFPASQAVLDTATASEIPNIAGRCVISKGREEEIVQSPLISDEEVARAVRISKDFPKHEYVEFVSPESIVDVEKFTRFDFVEFAITKLDGRLSPGRIHEEVGNEIATLRKLRFMAEDIIDDTHRAGDVLEHDGRMYNMVKRGAGWALVERTDEPESPDGPDEEAPLNRSNGTHAIAEVSM